MATELLRHRRQQVAGRPQLLEVLGEEAIVAVVPGGALSAAVDELVGQDRSWWCDGGHGSCSLTLGLSRSHCSVPIPSMTDPGHRAIPRSRDLAQRPSVCREAPSRSREATTYWCCEQCLPRQMLISARVSRQPGELRRSRW